LNDLVVFFNVERPQGFDPLQKRTVDAGNVWRVDAAFAQLVSWPHEGLYPPGIPLFSHDSLYEAFNTKSIKEALVACYISVKTNTLRPSLVEDFQRFIVAAPVIRIGRRGCGRVGFHLDVLADAPHHVVAFVKDGKVLFLREVNDRDLRGGSV